MHSCDEKNNPLNIKMTKEESVKYSVVNTKGKTSSDIVIQRNELIKIKKKQRRV